MTSSSKKKRDRNSMFDAVHLLDSQDAQAERKRQARSQRWTEQSLAAQSQTKIYSSLVECRILLQQSLHEANKKQDFEEDELGQCNKLLTKLLEARQALVNRNDAQTDYESAVEDREEQLSELLQSEYETVRDSWKEVLNRRHKDVRLHAGLTAKTQFKVLDSSFWQQVEATAQHEQQQQKIHSDSSAFDDSKVYQQMLKDFVSSAASQLSGSSSGAVAAQERLRGKQQQSATSKKQVDRKASKGRKIRYHEIPKLVNFTFPISRPNSGAMDVDEWFRSLFGGVGKQS